MSAVVLNPYSINKGCRPTSPKEKLQSLEHSLSGLPHHLTTHLLGSQFAWLIEQQHRQDVKLSHVFLCSRTLSVCSSVYFPRDVERDCFCPANFVLETDDGSRINRTATPTVQLFHLTLSVQIVLCGNKRNEFFKVEYVLPKKFESVVLELNGRPGEPLCLSSLELYLFRNWRGERCLLKIRIFPYTRCLEERGSVASIKAMALIYFLQ